MALATCCSPVWPVWLALFCSQLWLNGTSSYRERDDRPYDQSQIEEIFYRRILTQPVSPIEQ